MKTYKVVIDVQGTERWYNEDGNLHREGDQPAVIYENGTQFWFKNGKAHRDGDLPADIYANGTKFWYKNGKKHRDGDKPAVIWTDGDQEWWKSGKKLTNEEVKNLSKSSSSCENSIVEVNGQKFKLVKV